MKIEKFFDEKEYHDFLFEQREPEASIVIYNSGCTELCYYVEYDYLSDLADIITSPNEPFSVELADDISFTINPVTKTISIGKLVETFDTLDDLKQALRNKYDLEVYFIWIFV